MSTPWFILSAMALALVCAVSLAEKAAFSCPAGVSQVPGRMAPASTEAGDISGGAGEEVTPQVHEILDRLEARAAGIQTLQAKVRYDRIQELQGDRQRRFGTLYYKAGPPAQFAAHLDQLLADRRLEPLDRWYIFDGIWLVEKIADQNPRQFIKRQVAPPDSPRSAQQADPLALGDGPFVLPVGFNKQRILSRFQVELISAEVGNDPAEAESLHLRLTPRPGRRQSTTQIDLWYDARTLLPLRARGEDADSGNVSLIDLSKLQVNESFDESILDTREPAEAGWDLVIKPWEDK